MTAATDPATLAQAGGQPSQGARQAPRSGPLEGRPDRAAGAVRDAPAATRATVAQSARTAVPAPRRPGPGAVISDGSATTFVASRGHVSQQVTAAPHGGRRGRPGQGEPSAAAVVEAGTQAPCGLCQLRAERGIADPPGGCTCQAPGTVVQAGAKAAAVAYADGLDGAERKLLLHHIAQHWPEVVHAGAELVAQWRAEAAERRREAERERHRQRKRRQRAAARGQS